ncbi:alpha/beta fold hydrolase [Pseudomonas sp. ok266]|uniref:alpha/beta fold hydrolase n=1 Tax=Pseudomonas sp. ok266 TaxID=1761896 RepID=UPI0008D62B51|nr:alpha/beta hydrolase [Pseudomonas sp. ok266]SEN94217.1 Pimeloyl-ACP methyl ester carboxylesterase [Pseudomonas sp. ok266]
MSGKAILFCKTASLTIAYEAHGPETGVPVILLHGFPYSPRAYDEIAPLLAAQGYRVIVPYLRGYGQTRFNDAQTLRSGQQAALAQDLLNLMDALSIEQATLCGYDWGGRAACIVAALFPERVRGLVTGDGYNLQDIPNSIRPLDPETEHRFWYQYYFHTPRGVEGLKHNRREFCELLWRLWSPTWSHAAKRFPLTAPAFDNPDFVDVVTHSYRHRFMYVAGDPAFELMEDLLIRQPTIGVPTISLCGADDGVGPAPQEDEDAEHFTGFYERRVLPDVGHNIPEEAPEQTLKALLDLLQR